MSEQKETIPENKPIKDEDKFTLKRLSKVIKKMNSFINNTDTRYNDKKEKRALYLKAYLDYLKRSSPSKDFTFKSVHFFLSVSKSIYIKYGGELIDLFYALYNDREFDLAHKETKTEYEFFIYMFFSNNDIIKKLLNDGVIILDSKERKIKVDYDKIYSLPIDFFPSVNYIIDLLLVELFTCVDLKSYYISISALLMGVNRNMVKYFKIVSLFGLCFWQMKDKHKFIGSLLFIGGGVLRDLGRCYLKTKGIFNENLSYHKCSKGKGAHNTHFFSAGTLLEKECDYFKYFSLPLLGKFIQVIIQDLYINNNSKYWDDYISLFSSYSDKKENQNEDIDNNIPPEIKLLHFLYLFLSDFIFLFLSNFSVCEMSDKGNIIFNCNFSGERGFILMTLNIFAKYNRNLFNILKFAKENKSFLEVECEKTEYELKDKFNYYGIGLIFILMLTKQYSSDFKSYLPLICNKDIFKKEYCDILLFILKTENEAENKFTNGYEKMCEKIAMTLKKKNMLTFDNNDTTKTEIKSQCEKAKINTLTLF